MSWNCVAIDHGITIFPNGKIGPCCQISADYLKPISEISNPKRFLDLKTPDVPRACEVCNRNEHNQLPSYRALFTRLNNHKSGLQFVDIRNTNLCNLKCRYCGPHFSSQWADELGTTLQTQSIAEYKNILITDSLQWMYFTGGEPLINAEHWELLQELINNNQASGISLLYSTNLTTIKYKNLDIVDLWKHFKSVQIQCSIDAVGKPLEYIRSGSSWEKIKNNIEVLSSIVGNNITISVSPVLSILNIWFVKELFEYAQQHSLKVNPIILSGPDYLALDVVPDQLKSVALDAVDQIQSYIKPEIYNRLHYLINNNINQCLIHQTINHVLLLDNNRNEKLFDLLPFKNLAQDLILKNHEYK